MVTLVELIVMGWVTVPIVIGPDVLVETDVTVVTSAVPPPVELKLNILFI
jgi:hypothetical protein